MITKSILKVVLLISLPALFAMEAEQIEKERSRSSSNDSQNHDPKLQQNQEEITKALVQKAVEYGKSEEGLQAAKILEFHMNRYYPQQPMPGSEDDY